MCLLLLHVLSGLWNVSYFAVCLNKVSWPYSSWFQVVQLFRNMHVGVCFLMPAQFSWFEGLLHCWCAQRYLCWPCRVISAPWNEIFWLVNKCTLLAGPTKICFWNHEHHFSNAETTFLWTLKFWKFSALHCMHVLSVVLYNCLSLFELYFSLGHKHNASGATFSAQRQFFRNRSCTWRYRFADHQHWERKVG